LTAFDPGIHALRRERFMEQLGAAAAVIPAAALTTHHADCEWPFRQDSDFFYLTGFDEPDAVALLLPHRPEGERFVLFVQPKDPAAEVWTGFRWGTEGALERYGADLAHPLDQLQEKLSGYLNGAGSYSVPDWSSPSC
jgi:Xaa-Pro aminopeptidase